MNISDPHDRLSRWILNQSDVSFPFKYVPGLEAQVPDALSGCAPKERDDYKVDNDIPIFDVRSPVVTSAQDKERIEAEQIPEE